MPGDCQSRLRRRESFSQNPVSVKAASIFSRGFERLQHLQSNVLVDFNYFGHLRRPPERINAPVDIDDSLLYDSPGFGLSLRVSVTQGSLNFGFSGGNSM